MKPEVSIIIVNYNTLALLNNCIKSIKENVTNITYEIIVVDNNSSDDINSLKNNRDFSSLNLKLIKLPQNIGFGRANNEGSKIAGGKYLLFLNPDTIMINNAISLLVNYISSNIDVGACGGNLYDEKLNPTRSYRRRFFDNIWLLDTLLSANYIGKWRYGLSLYFNDSESPLSVSYIVGADLLVRKDLFLRIGGFNPGFFMYYEEVELCHRIISEGYKVINIPYAKIQHLEGKSNSNIEFKSKQMFNSAKLYFKLTQKKFPYIISRVLYFLLALQRCMIYSFPKNRNKHTYWHHQLKNFFTF